MEGTPCRSVVGFGELGQTYQYQKGGPNTGRRAKGQRASLDSTVIEQHVGKGRAVRLGTACVSSVLL